MKYDHVLTVHERMQLAAIVGYCAQGLQQMAETGNPGPLTSEPVDTILRLAGLTRAQLKAMAVVTENGHG